MKKREEKNISIKPIKTSSERYKEEKKIGTKINIFLIQFLTLIVRAIVDI